MTHAYHFAVRHAFSAVALLSAVLLVLIGFAIDGTTEVGHHAVLILAGVCVGYALSGARR